MPTDFPPQLDRLFGSSYPEVISWQRWLFKNAVAAASMVIAGLYGLMIARHNSAVAVVWPAAAVALASIAYCGWRLLPGVAIGQLITVLSDGIGVRLAPLMLVPLLVQLAIAFWAMRRVRLTMAFERGVEALHLGWISLVASAAAAFVGVQILVMAGRIPQEATLRSWLSWSLGDAIGILAFAPAFLLWLRPKPAMLRPKLFELGLMTAYLALISTVVLLDYRIPVEPRTIPTLFATFPLLMWVGLRADLRTAASFLVLTSVVATIGARLETGAMWSADPSYETLSVQSLHALGVMLVLLVASSVSVREDALRKSKESETRLALVFNETTDSHLLFAIDDDARPRVLMANRRFLAAIHRFFPTFRDQDIAGLDARDLGRAVGASQRDIDLHASQAHEALARREQSIRTYEIDSERGPRKIERTLTPVFDQSGRATYLLDTARDVTDRLGALEQLRESELRFAAVSDATRDVQILFAVGPDERLTAIHMNNACHEVIRHLWPEAKDGASNAAPLTVLLDRGILPKELVERNRRYLIEALTTRRPVRFLDDFTTPTGRRVSEVTITPIASVTGVVTHLLRTSADITARQTAEEQSRRFSEDLERRVKERTEQLEATNRELQAFSYSVSHDLRAPLRSMQGFTRALLEDYGSQLSAEAHEYATRAHAASIRLRQLLDDLQRLSRLSVGDVSREPVDASRIAADIVAELRLREPQRTIDVSIEPEIIVRGDARLIALALENLISNAWKYTARASHATVAIERLEYHGITGVVVRDNGVGFDPQYAEHLFAPFARLHKSSDFEGAGIGLASVRRVATGHGGRVWAESALGSGATFFITFEPAPTEH